MHPEQKYTYLSNILNNSQKAHEVGRYTALKVFRCGQISNRFLVPVIILCPVVQQTQLKKQLFPDFCETEAYIWRVDM